jgi:membrane protease YdiL (CAAX protease family)
MVGKTSCSAGKKDVGRGVTCHRNEVLRGLFCLILGCALNLVWSRLLVFLQIQQQFSNETQESLFAGQMIVQLLSMGLFVPLSEELVFRGLIYRRMRRILPYGQAVVLASALFAVYHGNMIQMIFAFPMAVVICILYEKWESLRYPVLFHMGCNLAAILINSL